jgi:hypothetical protein
MTSNHLDMTVSLTSILSRKRARRQSNRYANSMFMSPLSCIEKSLPT